jgi:hypothetical protein
MPLFRKRLIYPPTPFGYVPPPDAEVVGWQCTNRDCATSDHEADLRRWPTTCKLCGSPIGTGYMREPWESEAKRVELDSRLSTPRDEIDRELAFMEDFEWRYDDALRRRDLQQATHVRLDLDSTLLRRAAESKGYGEGYHRFKIVWAAVDAGYLDDAAAELAEWFRNSNADGVDDDNERRTNCRQLASMAVKFLEQPAARQHPASKQLYEQLAGLVYQLRNVRDCCRFG